MGRAGGRTSIDFTWIGSDEGDEISGEGSAKRLDAAQFVWSLRTTEAEARLLCLNKWRPDIIETPSANPTRFMKRAPS